MRKLQKAMIVLFCTGVCLTGVGTGIAFSEFSSFTYAGEKDCGPVDMRTDDFDYAIKPSGDETEEPLLINRYSSYYMRSAKLVESDDIPKHTVRFQVTYNAESVRPYLGYGNNQVWLNCEYIQDDFKTFMINKDQLLQDLKERKISTYRTQMVQGIKILVNPADADTIELME